MPRPPIDMERLEMAFAQPEGMEAYLNTETGEIVFPDDDVTYAYEEFEKTDEGPDEGMRERLVAWLETSDYPQWQHDDILAYHDLESNFERYAEIPRQSSPDAFQEMEEFVGTVTDAKLRERLITALRGQHPFRRFKDVLLDYPEQREQWFAFEQGAERRGIERWLHYVFGHIDHAEEDAAADSEGDGEYPPLRLVDGDDEPEGS